MDAILMEGWGCQKGKETQDSSRQKYNLFPVWIICEKIMQSVYGKNTSNTVKKRVIKLI